MRYKDKSMPPEKETESARQSDRDRSTFVILIISTLVAALIAIGAYLYVSSTENEELRDDIPEVEPQEYE